MRARVLCDDKGGVKSLIPDHAQTLFLAAAYRGDTRTQGKVFREQCEEACLDVFFLGSPVVGAHTGQGPWTVTSRPFRMPVGSSMCRPATRLEESGPAPPSVTHTHTHTKICICTQALPFISKVLHCRSTLFPLIKWAERTEGRVLVTISEYTLNKFALHICVQFDRVCFLFCRHRPRSHRLVHLRISHTALSNGLFKDLAFKQQIP